VIEVKKNYEDLSEKHCSSPFFKIKDNIYRRKKKKRKEKKERKKKEKEKEKIEREKKSIHHAIKSNFQLSTKSCTISLGLVREYVSC